MTFETLLKDYWSQLTVLSAALLYPVTKLFEFYINQKQHRSTHFMEERTKAVKDFLEKFAMFFKSVNDHYIALSMEVLYPQAKRYDEIYLKHVELLRTTIFLEFCLEKSQYRPFNFLCEYALEAHNILMTLDDEHIPADGYKSQLDSLKVSLKNMQGYFDLAAAKYRKF